MKQVTEKELAEIIMREVNRVRHDPDEWDDTNYQEAARAAAQALGVPLAPEPKEEAAEEWPEEWWGKPIELEPYRGNGEGAGHFRVDKTHLTRGLGRLSINRQDECAADRRALVAAYEAARKAGCLPGLEARGAIIGVSGTRWVPGNEAWRDALNAEAESWGQPAACHPDDAELAQRARAALAELETRSDRIGRGSPSTEVLVLREALNAVFDLLRGQQPASGREGE